MANVIPSRLHAGLSPLLVRAGEWPEAGAFAELPPPPAEGGDLDAQPDPDALAALEDALGLLHPALRGGPLRRQLRRTQDGALYYRLRARRPDPGEDLPQRAWSGWASWAPCAPVRAFAASARVAARRGPADADALAALADELLAPELAAELRARPARAAPSAQGPEHYAATWWLDPARYGTAWALCYAYTDGRRLLVALQPLLHESQ